ncbi:hypothetical protein BCR44DRAFT_1512455 [Catenaria anguillulae PL171]|uniref:G-protein coupled receptors family 3 profile domain-containing protein n=1 Tax=Catenaria anguillulae PL171 TaxID=765915 RepID=A0A1Y2HU48_9FUNG|nr:hypothetical protein BCR44DRAFT_1512455 [Catenaria anguillulae PL171]
MSVQIIWPAVYTDLLTPLNSYLSPAVVGGFAPGLTDAATLVRVRTLLSQDLLDKYNYTSPPQTWQQVEQIMAHILPLEHALGNTQLSGYTGQFAPYEGLTCNIMELLGTAGGLVNPDGTLSIMSDPPQAVEYSTQCVCSAAGLTLGGGVGAVAPIPGFTLDTLGQTTNGAHYYGVNKYSRNVASAFKVLQFITSDEAQLWWSREAGHQSSRTRVLADCQVANACDLQNLKPVSRPSAATGTKYPQVSTLLSTHWHNMLIGRITPEDALDRLTWDIANLLNINLLGPPVTVEWGSPVGIVAIIIASIAQVLTLSAGFPLVNSKGWSREQRRASPKLIMALLAGVALTNVWPLVFLGSPSALTCMLRPTIPGFAWATVLSIMAVQDLQVYLVVATPLRTVAADVHRRMRFFLLAVLLLQVGMTGLYIGVAAPKPTVVTIGREYRYAGCAWSSVSWIGQESAMLTLITPTILLVVNSLLAVRLAVIEKVSTVHRVPVLRIVYLILVLFLVSITALAVNRIRPSTRVLILTGVVLAQAIGVIRLYVLPRVIPDTSITSLAWMGETNAGMTTGTRTSAAAAALTHASSINDAASGGSKNLELLKSSVSFACRTAASARHLDFKPSVPCVVTLIRGNGILVIVEATHSPSHHSSRLRSVFCLRGRLASVEATSQHNHGGCVTQSLRLTFINGQVAELSSSGAQVISLIREWLDELKAFAASAEESAEILSG